MVENKGGLVMIQAAAHLIERFRLEKHSEGGFYRETYRSPEILSGESLPGRYRSGGRAMSTAIYFLLAGDDFSAFHRIRSDEIWHFYTGSPIKLHTLSDKGDYRQFMLGSCYEKGELFQLVISAGTWFAASLARDDSYGLVGCTVAPGFDFQDFELGERQALIDLYPEHRAVIERFTR
jgi:predicted cupin superfamily sugar epimerase